MPELPEVETIKIDLNRLLKNKKIKSVDINLNKQIKGSKAIFLKLVKGAVIKSVKRRAKILIVELKNGYYLIFHLKMTGQLIYRDKKRLAGGGHPINQDLLGLPNKYSHIIFNFIGGAKLFFNDTRQFGWVKVVDQKELDKIGARLGPEPLQIRKNDFIKLIQSRRGAIKPLLMNQQFIAGIGNIYAQEALYAAHILPTRLVSSLQDYEISKLYTELRSILKLAIKQKGTSSSDYINALGRKGSMMEYLKVYNKAGEKCVECGGKLKLIKQGQRSTVYCSKCQV